MDKAEVLAGYHLFKAKFFGKRVPLVVGWSVTNRCNWRCTYCVRWVHNSEELATKQIFSIIDELSDMGTYSINYTGGEPLLRDDIGRIASYAKAKGIRVGISSNGTLIPERIYGIRGIDFLTLSYDGPQEVHDKQRQKGSYTHILRAIRVAKENNINVRLHTVLTKYNIDYIDFILEFARKFDLIVNFAIIEFIPFSIKEDIKVFLPPKEKYRSAIDKLIIKKRGSDKNIGNSVSGLKYLYQWPNYRKINCSAGRIYCRIEPNGDVFPCGNLILKSKPLNCVSKGFKDAFMNLKLGGCRSCWCDSRIEMNYIYSLDLKAILNTKSTGK